MPLFQTNLSLNVDKIRIKIKFEIFSFFFNEAVRKQIA